MFILKIPLIRKFFDWYFRKFAPPMVSYWKTKDKVRAKVIKTEHGYGMRMEGEDYIFPSYPRGHLLIQTNSDGSPPLFSRLKHDIKNKVFNDSWWLLEDGMSEKEIVKRLKETILPQIFEIIEALRFEILPASRSCRSVKELWRAFEEVEKKLPRSRRARVRYIKEIICFIFQEDDAYRFRFQWLAGFVNPNTWWKWLLGSDAEKEIDFALSLLEQAEVIGDMKERQRLLRRIVIAALKDPGVRQIFVMIVKELNWKELRLTAADKYYFRGKYFKVDYPWFQY